MLPFGVRPCGRKDRWNDIDRWVGLKGRSPGRSRQDRRPTAFRNGNLFCRRLFLLEPVYQVEQIADPSPSVRTDDGNGVGAHRMRLAGACPTNEFGVAPAVQERASVDLRQLHADGYRSMQAALRERPATSRCCRYSSRPVARRRQGAAASRPPRRSGLRGGVIASGASASGGVAELEVRRVLVNEFHLVTGTF